MAGLPYRGEPGQTALGLLQHAAVGAVLGLQSLLIGLALANQLGGSGGVQLGALQLHGEQLVVLLLPGDALPVVLLFARQ